MRALSATYQEEVEKLRARHAETFKLKARELRRLIQSDDLCAEAAEQRKAALAHSERLALLENMRAELNALWARSTASKDQLLKQLHDWVERAERSGIAQLQEFSQRLRCYAA
jgi:stearoyl-CoA desaturase (delta-9 desaturase)